MDNYIASTRILQQLIDKIVTESNPHLQLLLHSANLKTEQLTGAYKIKLIHLSSQSKARNFIELYGQADDLSVLRFAEYNLRDYLSALTNQILSTIDNDLISISFKTAKDYGILDIRRTSLILYNLISNSIIHSKTKTKELSIEASLRGDELVVSVADNGKPIPSSTRKTLFNAYENSINLTKNTDLLSINGLGLSVCKKLVSEMGGDIYYLPSHTINKFEFTIPQTHKAKLLRQDTPLLIPKDEVEFYMADAILSLICFNVD